MSGKLNSETEERDVVQGKLAEVRRREAEEETYRRMESDGEGDLVRREEESGKYTESV